MKEKWEAVLLDDWTDATYVEGCAFASAMQFTEEDLENGLQEEIHRCAKLIAAAPDLLEACEEMLDEVTSFWRSDYECTSNPDIENDIPRIVHWRKVIKKARGEDNHEQF